MLRVDKARKGWRGAGSSLPRISIRSCFISLEFLNANSSWLIALFVSRQEAPPHTHWFVWIRRNRSACSYYACKWNFFLMNYFFFFNTIKLFLYSILTLLLLIIITIFVTIIIIFNILEYLYLSKWILLNDFSNIYKFDVWDGY